MAEMALRLISTSVEVFAGSLESFAASSHNIPTKHPHISTSQQPAIAAGCYTNKVITLISTPFDDQCILELRTFYLDSYQSNSASHRLLFPAAILDTAYLRSVSNDTLILQVCTLSGVIYRILLPLELLGSIEEIPARWISEHQIGYLGSDPQDIYNQGLLTSFHTSQDGNISLAACTDGRVVKIVWEESSQSSGGLSGSWQETILRPDTFFSRLFNRATSSSAPSQVLSMATYNRSNHWKHTLGFTASRDRKLRVWDLGSDACIRIVDLPALLESSEGDHRSLAVISSDPSSSEDGARDGSLFSTSPLLRVHATSDAVYIIVYIPAPLPSGNFIACYQVHFEGRSINSNNSASSTLGHIELVWQIGCDEETRGWNSELRDLAITSDLNQSWSIWGLWSSAGRTLVKRTEGLDGNRKWSSVSSPLSYSPLHGLALEDDLKAVTKAEDMAEFFMRRIVEPGRFSQASLEQALQDYEDLLLDREGVLPKAATTSASYSLKEQICSLIGCTIELEEEKSTGTLLHEAHWSALRKEWTTFVNLVEDYEAKESWPIGFVQGRQNTEEPFVVSRGRISLPIPEDASSTILRTLQKRTISSEVGPEEGGVQGVLSFASKLFHAIHPAALDNFERKLLEMLATQTSIPPENIADAVWSLHLQGEIEDEDLLEEEFALLGEDVKVAISQVLRIIQHSPALQTGMDETDYSPTLTELDAALCSDAITQVSCDRLTLARLLNVLCFAITVGYLHYDETDVLDEGPAMEELLGDVVATYHRLYAFDVLARRDGTIETVHTEPSQDDGDVADPNTVAQEMENLQFGREAINASALTASTSPANLVHACILRRRIGAEITMTSSSLSLRIYQFSVKALQNMLFPKEEPLQPIDLTPSLALIADDIIKSGHPSASSAFVELFACTPASHFLLARSHLLCNEVELAATAFEKVIPAFYRLKEEHSEYGSGVMELLSPAVKRAQTTAEAKFCYFRRVMSFYEHQSSPSHFFIAHFSKMAIDAATSLSDCNTRSLQEARFNSLLALEWYEDAYTHLMSIPYMDEQRRLLPDLISRMCEQGHVDGLLSLNFASLQVDVVNTLSFKARNSKTLEEIDFYFDLLYAFYVKRGDLKNAGATMWQMGTRLRQMAQSARGLQGEDIDEEEIRQLSIMEARCYLSCINVLTQLDVRDAWFAHDTGGAEEEVIMETKLTRYVPTSSFVGKARDNLRIVNLQDIRRRYQVRLAQLELFSIRPHYSTSILTTDRNDANNVISLFTSNDDFEKAFTIARLLSIDRTQIYTSLTDRCLELSKWEQARKARATEEGWSEHPLIQSLLDDQESPLDDQGQAGFLNRIDRCITWTGTASQRAWKYLRMWLCMEGDNRNNHQTGKEMVDAKYHLIVFNRILYWDQFSITPSWLYDWLRINEQEFLVKSLLSNNLLKPALEESLQMITEAKGTLSRKRKHKAAEVYLPYLLLDELLKRAEEGGQSSASDSILERRSLAKQVRNAIDLHKETLQKMQSQSAKERDEDERRLKRYQELQRGQQDVADVTMS